MTKGIDLGELAQYLGYRAQERQRESDLALSAMTKRERALVAEVATMVYVRTAMEYGGYDRQRAMPPISDVLSETVYACLSMRDLYPTIGRLHRLGHRRKKRAECTAAPTS